MAQNQRPTRYRHGAHDADVSRRSFLIASSAGAVCTAFLSLGARTTANDAEVERSCLILNASHVLVELRIMRNHFLPFLLRQVQWDNGARSPRLVPPTRETLCAFRETVDGLFAQISSTCEPHAEHDIGRVLAPARRHLGTVQRRCLLQPRTVDDDFVRERCSVDVESPVWVWKCSAMTFAWPEDLLEYYWREIQQLLGMPANARPDDLRFLDPRQIIASFQSLSEDEYFRLMSPLVQLFPTLPYQLFCIPDRWEGNAGNTISGLRGIRDRISYLMGETMERLANNSFMRLWPLVRREEMCGSWMGFIAGQVLDVLYQKTLVVTWMLQRADGGQPVFLDRA